MSLQECQAFFFFFSPHTFFLGNLCTSFFVCSQNCRPFPFVNIPCVRPSNKHYFFPPPKKKHSYWWRLVIHNIPLRTYCACTCLCVSVPPWYKVQSGLLTCSSAAYIWRLSKNFFFFFLSKHWVCHIQYGPARQKHSSSFCFAPQDFMFFFSQDLMFWPSINCSPMQSFLCL